MACHFCHDWAKYCILSWLPTYYMSHLHLTLTQSSFAALGPPLGSVFIGNAAGQLADKLIGRGVPVTEVRRLCQLAAFLGPAVAMALAWVLDSNDCGAFVVPVLSLGISLSSASLAGLYCSHQDISRKYAPVLLGLSNTAGALPGFFGVALTGYLYDQTESWNLALFLPSIVVLAVGATLWARFVRNNPEEFGDRDD